MLIDTDLDGIEDVCDLCPSVSDAGIDSDGDGLGDACDPCSADPYNDDDDDGLCGEVDPCPLDALNDGDLDGICGELDNCRVTANADQADSDQDSIGDACDPWPTTSNLYLLFTDGFEAGDLAAWSGSLGGT